MKGAGQYLVGGGGVVKQKISNRFQKGEKLGEGGWWEGGNSGDGWGGGYQRDREKRERRYQDDRRRKKMIKQFFTIEQPQPFSHRA